MKIWMPERILDRNVGGNTTYARNLARGLYEQGVEVHRMKAGKNAGHTLFLESLQAAKRHDDDSILHYVADTGPLVPCVSPSLVTVHGVASRYIKTARTPLQESIWRHRVASAIRHTQRLITVSRSSARDVSEIFGFPEDKIDVIHHGIDTSLFAGQAELSEKLQPLIPQDFALYVGNIEPRKNLVQLVRAIDELRGSSSSVPLVIAGRPAWNFEDSMRAIEKSPNVIYVGFVSDEDRRALMQRCRLFVFPSLYEGFGFPILEAMAAGAPVLSSDKGSLAEVGGPARIIPGSDQEAIAEAMGAALADVSWQESAPENGRRWARRFTWDKSVAEHVRVYGELLN